MAGSAGTLQAHVLRGEADDVVRPPCCPVIVDLNGVAAAIVSVHDSPLAVGRGSSVKVGIIRDLEIHDAARQQLRETRLPPR
jgi:hypothetical protein